MHILLIKNKGATALLCSETLRKIIMGVSIPLLFQTIRYSGKSRRPFFPNKVNVSNSIALSEKDSSNVCQLFNDFFSNAVLSLNIKENNFKNINLNEDDPIKFLKLYKLTEIIQIII